MATMTATTHRHADLDGIGPRQDKAGPGQAKADLESRATGLPWNQAQGDLIVRYYGSVKAAAYALDVDPSLMQREHAVGKFSRFNDRADEKAKAYVANGLAEIFGVVMTRESRITQLKRTIEDSLNEMVQLAVSA